MSNPARANARQVFADFNISAPGANTGIITGGILPSPGTVALRVTIALTTSSVLNLTVTDGTTTHKLGIDKSVALQAADLYAWEFAVARTDAGGTNLTYNLEVETDGVVELLIIDEIAGPAS